MELSLPLGLEEQEERAASRAQRRRVMWKGMGEASPTWSHWKEPRE